MHAIPACRSPQSRRGQRTGEHVCQPADDYFQDLETTDTARSRSLEMSPELVAAVEPAR